MLDSIAAFIAVGFAAQMVDGALGMAYGVTATSILLAQGITPAVASASVHAAETFTTAASGASHWRLGNVEKKLLWRLAVPGIVGGVLGALVLTAFPGEKIRPFVALYLLFAGVIVLVRGLNGSHLARELSPNAVKTCGFVAGFLDAAGGGGWGLLVTSSLMWGGLSPRRAIGTACLAEFFVTTAVTLTFLGSVGTGPWPVVLGLIIGGVIAAPIAAYAARHVPERPMMIGVGALVMGLSLREVYKAGWIL